MELPSSSKLDAELIRVGAAPLRDLRRLEGGGIVELALQDDTVLWLLECSESLGCSWIRAAWAREHAGGAVPFPSTYHAIDAQWLLTSPLRGLPAGLEHFGGSVWSVLESLRGLVGEAVEWPSTHGCQTVGRPWDGLVERADRLAAQCGRWGRDPVLIADLLRFILARRSAVEACSSYCLVHGGLSPVTLRMDDCGCLIEVIDWSRAHVGDPLEDWIPALTGPEIVGRSFVESVPKSLRPGSVELARLECYHALLVLELLSEGGAPGRSTGAMFAARTQLGALEAGWIPALFRGGSAPSRVPPEGWQRLTALLLEAIERGPPQTRLSRVEALAACLLARQLRSGGEDALFERCLRRAVRERGAVMATAHRPPAVENRLGEVAIDPMLHWLVEQTEVPMHPARWDRLFRAAGSWSAGLPEAIKAVVGFAASEGGEVPALLVRSSVESATTTLALMPESASVPWLHLLRLASRSLAARGWRVRLPELLEILTPREGRPSLLFVIPARTGWGELTLGMRIAHDLANDGFRCAFMVHPALVEGLLSKGHRVHRFPSARGEALLERLAEGLEAYDAWVLVDLHLGAAEFLEREVKIPRILELPCPLIGLDIWDYCRLRSSLDVIVGAGGRVDPAHWKGLQRRLVPVPFGQLDTPNACRLLPELHPQTSSVVDVRARLGVPQGRVMLTLCTSFWQHEMMLKRDTADVPSLLASYLGRLGFDWMLCHVGPEPLAALAATGRYQHLKSMPSGSFEDVLRASDLVLSFNGSATTNTTALALHTSVLWLKHDLPGSDVGAVATALGHPLGDLAVEWVRRHAPVRPFYMWPMSMVHGLGPSLAGNPYGALLNPTELLDQDAVLQTIGALVNDPEERERQAEAREAYLIALAEVRSPAECVRGFLEVE